MKFIAELQHICTKKRLNWTSKMDVAHDIGVLIAGSAMVPILTNRSRREREDIHAHHGVQKISINVIMKDKLKTLKKLEANRRSKIATINALSTNAILKTHPRQYLCLILQVTRSELTQPPPIFLNNCILFSRIGFNNMPYCDLKNIQVSDAKHNLLKILPVTQQFDMSGWSGCSIKKKISYSETVRRHSDNETTDDSVATTKMKGSDDIAETIHAYEAQHVSDHSDMCVTPVESIE